MVSVSSARKEDATAITLFTHQWEKVNMRGL
jgi:hypothetical protein